MKPTHGVGGAARRVAPGGSGSSPDESAFPTTNSKYRLRRMLAHRDRELTYWQWNKQWIRPALRPEVLKVCLKMDQERRLIREKIKRLGKPEDLHANK